MLSTNILDPKVIDRSDKLDGACVMLPKSRNQLALEVSMLVQMLSKELVG